MTNSNDHHQQMLRVEPRNDEILNPWIPDSNVVLLVIYLVLLSLGVVNAICTIDLEVVN